MSFKIITNFMKTRTIALAISNSVFPQHYTVTLLDRPLISKLLLISRKLMHLHLAAGNSAFPHSFLQEAPCFLSDLLNAYTNRSVVGDFPSPGKRSSSLIDQFFSLSRISGVYTYTLQKKICAFSLLHDYLPVPHIFAFFIGPLHVSIPICNAFVLLGCSHNSSCYRKPHISSVLHDHYLEHTQNSTYNCWSSLQKLSTIHQRSTHICTLVTGNPDFLPSLTHGSHSYI
jgi:hypothetical protein